MNKLMLGFQLVSAIIAVLNSPKGKETIDNILDMLEDNFPDVPTVVTTCASARIILNVPDDDD